MECSLSAMARTAYRVLPPNVMVLLRTPRYYNLKNQTYICCPKSLGPSRPFAAPIHATDHCSDPDLGVSSARMWEMTLLLLLTHRPHVSNAGLEPGMQQLWAMWLAQTRTQKTQLQSRKESTRPVAQERVLPPTPFFRPFSGHLMYLPINLEALVLPPSRQERAQVKTIPSAPDVLYSPLLSPSSLEWWN